MRFILFFLFLVFHIPFFGQTAERDGIVSAMQSGNSKALGAFFSKTVDLVVVDVEDAYSKDQAQMIVSRFFSNHSPSAFEVKHDGKSKLDDYYYIGNLHTSNGTFRVTLFLKKEADAFKIRQLRIEPD